MLSLDSQLSLEPVFCKSTGAYRAQVSEFCHVAPSLGGSFKLSRAKKPVLLDADRWLTELPGSEGLRVNKNILIEKDVRSILNRKEINVTALILPQSGFIVELNSISSTREELLAGHLITTLKERHCGNFNSIAVTLIRHGILTFDNEALIRSSRSTGVFQAENWVETVQLENRTFLRSILSGRIIDLTDHPFVVDLIESGSVYQAEDHNVSAFEHLCRLGMFRQITKSSDWSEK